MTTLVTTAHMTHSLQVVSSGSRELANSHKPSLLSEFHVHFVCHNCEAVELDSIEECHLW